MGFTIAIFKYSDFWYMMHYKIYFFFQLYIEEIVLIIIHYLNNKFTVYFQHHLL